MSKPRFEVDREEGKLLGVCAGLAKATGVDATIVRVGFVLATVFLHGFPWVPLAYVALALIGHRKALEMALFGERIQAREAKEIGLINYVVPDERLEEETEKLVLRLVNGPTVAYGLIKKLMHASWKNSIAEQAMLEGELYGNFAMPSRDAHEGLKAFFEKRPPRFVGR